MGKEPEWNVFIYNYNTGSEGYQTFNVFRSYNFYDSLVKIKKELKKNNNDFEWFSEKLRIAAWGAFGCKFEYELEVLARGTESWRIDVYDQLRLNWNLFVQYVWDNIKHINKSKIK